METTTIIDTFNRTVTPEELLKSQRENFELEEKKERLAMDKEDILIKKVDSLMQLLESIEPIEEDNKTVLEDRYPLRSIFSEANKEVIRKKIFKLIEKY